MPLLYGEGFTKAFERLQIQIMDEFGDDQSLLAWENDGKNERGRQDRHKLLAPHPDRFASCDKIKLGSMMNRAHPIRKTIFEKTPRGFEFHYELPRGLRPNASLFQLTAHLFFVLCPLSCAQITHEGGSAMAVDGPDQMHLLLGVQRPTAKYVYQWDFLPAKRLGVVSIPRHDQYRAVEQALGWEYPSLLLNSDNFATLEPRQPVRKHRTMLDYLKRFSTRYARPARMRLTLGPDIDL